MPAQRMESIPFSGIRTIVEKCSRLERDGRNIVHLEIGRPDFDTPNPIKDAGKRALDEGRVHYTSNWGIPELRQRIGEKFSRDNNLDYDWESEIVVTSGATEAVFTTIVALIEEGDEVLVPGAAWTYEPAIRTAGGTPVRYHTAARQGFEPTTDSIRDAMTDRTKLLILNTPNNPTGSCYGHDTLSAIRDVAVDADLTVLSDEIYEKLIFDGRRHESIAAYPGMSGRTVTINGFSKAFSMTGWRLGYLGGPARLVDAIIRLRQYTSTCAPSIAQHAGIKALSGPYHEPLVEAFEQRRDLVQRRLEAIPAMSAPDLQGAFYAFPSIPAGFDDDTTFVHELLDEAGVALVPGSDFGPDGKGRVRMAYSNSEARINEGFDRLEAFLENR